jgi:predicted nucleic-acid-binding protein
MRAVDTNVLVRLVTRDDRKQVAAAESFVSKGAWVSTLVLTEATWVLTAVYDLSHAENRHRHRHAFALSGSYYSRVR